MPDMLEAMAVGGLFRWPAAREHAERLGGVACLFRGRVVIDVALEAMGEPEGLILDADDQRDAIAFLTLAMDHVPSTPEWAIYCLDRLARERSALMLAPTLEWAAYEMRAGSSAAFTARRVMDAFTAAGVDT